MCIFLFSLATADRNSEVHSFLRGNRHVTFGENLEWVRIVPNVSILEKNESPANRRKAFVIKALKVKGRHSPVCPVFCLSEFWKASKDFNSKFLFINPRSGRPCSKFVLAQMLVRNVKWACPGYFPRSHDVRKVSGSKAFLARMSMRHILKRGSWKSGKVFDNQYLAKSFLGKRRYVVMGSSA